MDYCEKAKLWSSLAIGLLSLGTSGIVFAAAVNPEKLAPPGPERPATYPWRMIPGRAELLIDDVLIDHAANVTRTFHPAEKRPDPVLTGTKAWETGPGPDGCAQIYGMGGVAFDETDGLFKAWLNTCAGDQLRNPACAYYTSRDGIHWKRPCLGIVEFDESRDNNIIYNLRNMPDFGALVHAFIDPIDPNAQRRYKLLFACNNRETGGRYYRVAWSPDNRHWQLGELIWNDNMADCSYIVPDVEAGKYRWYKRTQFVSEEIAQRENLSQFFGRAVACLESIDLRQWSHPALVYWTTPDMPAGCDAHSMPAFKYESHFIGLPSRARYIPGCWYKDHQLAWSRDGVHWSRWKDGVFIPLGEVGGWDQQPNYALPPFVYKDEIRIYYDGRNLGNGMQGVYKTGPENTACLGLATLPLDRFASLDSSFGGTIVTKPLLLPNAEIWVNVKSDFGSLVVGVLDENGNPIPGLVSQDIKSDGLCVAMKWKDAARVGRLTEAPIRLRFSLTNARLYAFGSGKRNDPGGHQ